jgi:hypothetical protein
VLPDMASACGVEQPYSSEQCTDTARGRFYFVGSGGDEVRCQGFEAGVMSVSSFDFVVHGRS